MQDKITDTLFVYGSFAQGMVHFPKIASAVEEVMPARVQGSMFRLPVGFPVFCENGFQRVKGHVVRLQKPELIFALLDQFHGVSLADPDSSLYHRKIVSVRLENLEWLDCAIYCGNPLKMPKNAQLIEDGDWEKALLEKPPVTGRLSERQRLYIQKLGSSSGRDIVPIDLALYRELINLEIVVDKGRRLALTSLGQDIFRYL